MLTVEAVWRRITAFLLRCWVGPPRMAGGWHAGMFWSPIFCKTVERGQVGASGRSRLSQGRPQGLFSYHNRGTTRSAQGSRSPQSYEGFAGSVPCTPVAASVPTPGSARRWAGVWGRQGVGLGM